MDRLRTLAETRGFFTRTDALQDGHDDRDIQRALRIRLWTRIRVGTYTFSDLWPDGPQQQHLIAARSVAHRLGHRVALSHTSAALVHDLTVWDADLTDVHTTRLDGGAGRRESGIWHHEGFLLDEDLVEIDGMLVVRPVRAAVETGMLVGGEQALVVLDSLLHHGHEHAELAATFELLNRWPQAQHLQVPVRMADGRAESAGESRTRYLCHVAGLPAPDLQLEVRDSQGHLVGTCDFGWEEHRLLGEFDGKVKYGRLLRPGEEPGDAVFREKKREDALREVTRWSMVRITWSELYRPAETAARIRRLMRRAA
jgi:hypothetical protein